MVWTSLLLNHYFTSVLRYSDSLPGGEPQHHCALDEGQSINESIPLVKESGQWRYSKCLKYVNRTISNDTMKCNKGWYYEPEYKETIITEVNFLYIQYFKASFYFFCTPSLTLPVFHSVGLGVWQELPDGNISVSLLFRSHGGGHCIHIYCWPHWTEGRSPWLPILHAHYWTHHCICPKLHQLCRLEILTRSIQRGQFMGEHYYKGLFTLA